MTPNGRRRRAAHNQQKPAQRAQQSGQPELGHGQPGELAEVRTHAMKHLAGEGAPDARRRQVRQRPGERLGIAPVGRRGASRTQRQVGDDGGAERQCRRRDQRPAIAAPQAPQRRAHRSRPKEQTKVRMQAERQPPEQRQQDAGPTIAVDDPGP